MALFADGSGKPIKSKMEEINKIKKKIGKVEDGLENVESKLKNTFEVLEDMNATLNVIASLLLSSSQVISIPDGTSPFAPVEKLKNGFKKFQEEE